jgi:hypothetical protein
MKLRLYRIYKAPTYTIGKLYVNGEYFADTLEDVVRPDGVKVYGETAIPAGVYKVILNVSNRFKCLMPLLLNVPNFDGIRIHSGNTAVDTHGCLLVGKNTEKGKITESKKAFIALMAILNSAKDEITIEIV